MENSVVNPMIMHKRVLMSDTKYSINIGIVISNGAKIVHRMSAAIEIFSSLYSVSPISSSAVQICLERPPMRRWYAPSKVSPIHRSTRSLLLCLEDKTKKSDSSFPTRPSLAHTREPGPRKEQSLPLALSSQLRSKLRSCLLGPSCLEISICCSNAVFYGVSVTHFDNRRMTT